MLFFAVQDYLVNILLETATKEHYEGARYDDNAGDSCIFMFLCILFY